MPNNEKKKGAVRKPRLSCYLREVRRSYKPRLPLCRDQEIPPT